MKNSVVLALFHFAVLGHHVYTVYYVTSVTFAKTDEPEVRKLKNYNSRMLTVWNTFFQVAYFAMALFTDIVDVDGGKTKAIANLLRYVKGLLFMSCVVPGTVIVATVFWGVFFLDRELIYPAVFDQIIPKWTNHCMHTNILIVVLLEVLLVNQLLPKYEMVRNVYAAAITGYICVMVGTYFLNGVWLYGFFVRQNWLQRWTTISMVVLLGTLSVKFAFELESWKSSLKNPSRKVRNVENGASKRLSVKRSS